MPVFEIFPLADAADLPALELLLNNQELEAKREVFQIDSLQNGEQIGNEVTVDFNLDVVRKERLKVVEVPAGATLKDRLQALTPVPAKAAKDAFLAFIAPRLDNHEALWRAEVAVNKKKVEIVLLRGAPPFKPVITSGTILAGTNWPWTAQVVGNDIVVQGAKTTAFGGANDTADNGQTASGYPTKGNPTLMGCALPLDGYAKTKAEKAALDGTPLPHMPFGLTKKGVDNPAGAHVEVTDPKTGRSITLPVIDLGPAKNTGHALDLTEAAARFFKSNATANNFSMILNYRLINGALALPAAQAPAAAPAGTLVPGGVKASIVKTAIDEWSFWGNSVPGNVGLVESNPTVLSHIESYWAQGVGTPKPGDFKTRWSAAFISYCMRKGGAAGSFHYNGQHSTYISRAIAERDDPNAMFWGYRLNEYPPQIGDVVCWASEPGVSYEQQKDGDYSGHCDIVVALGVGSLEIIGGNVSESVTRRHLAVDGQGCLKPSGNTNYLIAVMRNRLA